MPGVMTLRIITPENTVLDGVTTDNVIAPVVDGSMGILFNHAPMATALGIGVLRYKQGASFKLVAVSGGFMEVNHNKITILADIAETGESVDVLRAQEARVRAESRLREHASTLDRTRAEAALQRAISRLKAAGVLDEE
jgi:F-type H+-transporting ATPase subunit epsilon